MSAARRRGVGVLAEGSSVVLILADVDVRISPDAARALATLLLTCADLVEGTDDDDGEQDDEPTAPGRGVA